MAMLNHPALVPLVQLTLGGISTVALAGFVFAYYFKARYLPALQQPALSEARDPRRMFRIDYLSDLKLEDPSGRFFGESARLLNLSLGGLGFSSPILLREGERICVRLSSSAKRFLRIDGLIVWAKTDARESRYGLKIQDAAESR
jgi:PilZ domain